MYKMEKVYRRNFYILEIIFFFSTIQHRAKLLDELEKHKQALKMLVDEVEKLKQGKGNQSEVN